MPGCVRRLGHHAQAPREARQDRAVGLSRRGLWSGPERVRVSCARIPNVSLSHEKKAKSPKLKSTWALPAPECSALVRTILSQNTSNKNSTSARKGIEDVFGSSAHGGPNYEAVRQASQEQLMAAIQSGGLAKVKSKVIKTILDEVYDKYGTLSLEHLHTTPDQEAMKELVSFHGVGPKTASCVLLFTLSRESFAVDSKQQQQQQRFGLNSKRAGHTTATAHVFCVVSFGSTCVPHH